MTTIRDARLADLEAVAALDRELMGQDAWSSLAMADEFAQLGRTRRILVAAAAGQPIAGYAILLTVADVADVQRIGVATSAQGTGLGGRLLATAVERAADAGCERILLEVGSDNDAALALYSRHGFREISRRIGYYQGGVDAIVMLRGIPAQTQG